MDGQYRRQMKKTKIAYWVSTGLISLFGGVLAALNFNTEAAQAGMLHYGYPNYFGIALSLCKILGALALIIPQVPKVLKDLAYAGFVFDFIFAGISIAAVDGFGATILAPLIFLGVLICSYTSGNKLRNNSLSSS